MVRSQVFALRRWLLVLTLGAAACGGAGTFSQSVDQRALAPISAQVYPAAEWQRIDRPETVGWSKQGLDQVRAKLSTLSTTGFMAVVGGRVLMDYGDVQRVSYVARVRKSVLSML